jgi:hypothetical protein
MLPSSDLFTVDSLPFNEEEVFCESGNKAVFNFLSDARLSRKNGVSLTRNKKF